MDLIQSIKEAGAEAILSLFGVEYDANKVAVNDTIKDYEGNYTIVVFPLTRFSKQKPEETGHTIGAYLVNNNPMFDKYNVVKGFLNLTVSNNALINQFLAWQQSKNPWRNHSNGKSIMVEYCGPNTNKPLHLGHARNIVLGHSIIQMYRAAGYKVIKANIINDKGVHICKSMAAWIQFGEGKTPESENVKGDHFVGSFYVKFDKEYKKEMAELIANGMDEKEAKEAAPLMKTVREMLVKWENGDEEIRTIWSIMNGWVYDGFEETYKKIGVDFDVNYYESETYNLGKELVENGCETEVFYKKDNGSIWIDLEKDKLDHKLVLRSDGTSVYITQDIATAKLRFEDYPIEKIIYVVGNEQEYHFKVLQAILKRLDIANDQKDIFHLSYGMVELPQGKMKSREGTVVDADDLIDQMIETAKEKTLQKQAEVGHEGFPEAEANDLFRKLGLGALKFFLLKVNPRKGMMFNPEESIDTQGFTGPFVMYTYARIQSILRQSDLKEFNKNIDLESSERALILHLDKYILNLKEAVKAYDPSSIASYLFNLAKLFNRFYDQVHIMKETDENKKQFRLHLIQSTANAIQEGLNLLGIEVADRM